MNVEWWVVQGGEGISPCCPLPHLFVSKKYIHPSMRFIALFLVNVRPPPRAPKFSCKKLTKGTKRKTKKTWLFKNFVVFLGQVAKPRRED